MQLVISYTKVLAYLYRKVISFTRYFNLRLLNLMRVYIAYIALSEEYLKQTKMLLETFAYA